MIRRVFALLAVLLLAGGCMVGPGGRGPRDNRPPNRPPGDRGGGVHPGFQCVVYPSPPARMDVGDRSVIIGVVEAVCDFAPAEHVMHVGLDLYGPYGFRPTVNMGLNVFTECLQVPTPGNPVRCEHIVACVSGTYRTTVTVVGEGPDRQGFAYTELDPPQAEVLCPED